MSVSPSRQSPDPASRSPSVSPTPSSQESPSSSPPKLDTTGLFPHRAVSLSGKASRERNVRKVMAHEVSSTQKVLHNTLDLPVHERVRTPTKLSDEELHKSIVMLYAMVNSIVSPADSKQILELSQMSGKVIKLISEEGDFSSILTQLPDLIRASLNILKSANERPYHEFITEAARSPANLSTLSELLDAAQAHIAPLGQVLAFCQSVGVDPEDHPDLRDQILEITSQVYQMMAVLLSRVRREGVTQDERMDSIAALSAANNALKSLGPAYTLGRNVSFSDAIALLNQ